jgi:thiamine pyrophosphokinase
MPAEGSLYATNHPPRRRIFLIMARLVICANGAVPVLKFARQLIRTGDVLYAADGGTRHALALGLMPSVVVGDLDSLTQEERQQLDASGVQIHQFPRDKNRTDLELALDLAIEVGHREILIVGALGGRLDQTLGNLALLSNDRFLTCDIRLDDGVEEAFFMRALCEIHGRPADIVSLIPWGKKATGIFTEGLRWSLNNETLFPDQTRGISNEMLHETATIKLKSGLLFVIHHRNL